MTEQQLKRAKLTYVASGVGLLAGAYLAYQGKKSFWAYLGYGIGLSLLGTVAGNVLGVALIKDAPTTPVAEKEEGK